MRIILQDLEDCLNKCLCGLEILAYYDKNNELDENSQNNLTTIICNVMLSCIWLYGKV